MNRMGPPLLFSLNFCHIAQEGTKTGVTDPVTDSEIASSVRVRVTATTAHLLAKVSRILTIQNCHAFRLLFDPLSTRC
jgi:hypothetical protein